MLKNFSTLLSPELISVLIKMGHGDEIILSDANFPADSHAKRLILCNGTGIPELLDAIMYHFPLDKTVEKPVTVMQPPPEIDTPPVWQLYSDCIKKHEHEVAFEKIERLDFYKRAEQAYAIVATSEKARCANIILRKGSIIVTGQTDDKR